MRVSQDVGRVERGALLKGSDVAAAKLYGIGGVIACVRRSPQGFGSPYIVEFDAEVLPGISQWACNTTQSIKLAELIGDDTEKWKGWGIVLKICSANNPKTQKEVTSLEVHEVKAPGDVAKLRKSKPKEESQKATMTKINLSSVPF